MPARRSSAGTGAVPGLPAGRRPGTGLPEVSLASRVPDGAVLALPTRAGEAGAELLADVAGAAGLSDHLARESAKGTAGEVVALPALSQQRVLAFGIGAGGGEGPLRKAAAALARRVKDAPVLAVDLRALPATADVASLVEGLLLASYGFTLEQSPTPRVLQEVVLVVTEPEAHRPALDTALVRVAATAAARDLVNAPPAVKTPAWLAERAVELLPGLDVRVRDEFALAAEGFGGVLAVGQGSSRPPRFVEARWDGGAGPRVVLVGKGITFDSGGLSLKRGDGMLTMKMDMGGAAAVLATLRAVADLRLPLRVTALVAAAENLPSGSAQRPGDVLVQYGGRTVEVLNTDAEGRLVLADALAYADRVLQADVIVDVATLTGAMPVALGKRHAGLFCSDDALAAQLEAASEASGERLWRMPLVEDYRHALDSPVADLRNIGDPRKKLQGGSITAALFLREFTGGRPWAHLDIAGPAWAGGDEDELTKGGTGYGVRLLTSWLQALAA